MPTYENPIKVLREELGLTQLELSRELSCSISTILRTELGLYNDIPPLLMDWFRANSPIGSTPYADYKRYVVGKRITNSKLLQPITNIAFGEIKDTNPEKKPSLSDNPFIKWRKMNGYSSRLSFCEAFCLHPSTIIRFERGVARNPPEEVLDLFRSNELGLDELKKRYTIWRKSLKAQELRAASKEAISDEPAA